MRLSGRTATALVPYVPRLALEWADANPDALWREVDGSLVFVDISGFTALSEKLAKRGRQGAEELTGTLSNCFADLLAVAYAAGGSLLKFGGDALLLLFEGPDHASRAAMSALRMRATMADVGRVSTSVGSFRLRMSVGVHSGLLHLFRVGDSHRELIVTGPGASDTVTMEGTAQAGEIVVSPATARAIDERYIGAAKGPGYLLRNRAVLSVAESFPATPTPRSDISVAIPVALRDHLDGSVESEHRQATIAFVHFDDIDELITKHGAAAAADALHALTCDVQAAADDQGVTFLGSDVDHDGGKVILVAGAPQALGDDEGRMLRALRQVADTERVLPTRFGVNRGHVFVGEVGPHYRRTYTVMGDTVNLAARLMAKATPGEVIATSSVLDHSSTEFEARALEPFTVKGKAKPVTAFAVGAPVGRRRQGVDGDSPFVGRQAELAMLTEALERARRGQGGLVDISGDAGIGKSRLTGELKKQASDARVLTSFCEVYEAKTPYFAFRHLLCGAVGITRDTTDRPAALRDAVAAAAPELLPWLPLIGEVADIAVASTKEVDALDAQFRPERTRWAVVQLLRAVAHQPHVFIVEDGEWTDDPSAALLAEVATAAAVDRPWLVCLVHRADAGHVEVDDTAVLARIALGPLDEGASAELVAAATRDALLRPHERAAVVQQAGGNPLFLEELLRSFDPSGETAMPDSLEGVVATQIDRLPVEDRRLLRYCAVLGPIFETARLSDLVNADGHRSMKSANASLRRLRTFLEPAGPGWLRFRNQCYRQVAYETLPFGRRRELHARAGASLEAALGDKALERAETLSFHFLYAQHHEACWRYAIIAAQRAEAMYANVEAALLYERALSAGAHLADTLNGELAKTWEALGDVCIAAGIYDKAKHAFGRARRLVTKPVRLATLCKKEALVAEHQGAPTSVVRWTNRGLKLVADARTRQELSVRSELRLLRAERYQRMGRNREVLPWCEMAIADANAADDLRALARGYTVLDLAALALGRLDEITHLPRALEIWEELDNLNNQGTVLTILGATKYYQGQWDDALALFDRGRDAYLRSGDVVNAGHGTNNLADILIDQGRADEAEGGLVETLELWRSVRYPAGVAGVLLNLGRCALQRSDYASALALFEEAKSASASVSEAASVEADAWLAETLIHRGDPADALPLTEYALEREARLGSTMFVAKLHRVRGYALAALGRTGEAFDELSLSLDAARARDSLYDIALALEAVGIIRASADLPPNAAADAECRELLTRLGVRSTSAPRIAAAA